MGLCMNYGPQSAQEEYEWREGIGRFATDNLDVLFSLKGRLMAKTSKRRRVSPDKVRQNAATGASGQDFFKLPKNVREYKPQKQESVLLDILPYEVKTDNHPDRVEAGTLWYKYPFLVHHNIGANNTSLVCPTSVSKPCPICKERQKLFAAKDEDSAKTLTPKRHVAFNITDPDDEDRVAIFAFSRGKFADFLDEELKQADEENLNFFDVTKAGRTLKVRFSEDSFEGRKFLKATRIDFKARSEMDEEEVLGKVVCLDTMFNIMDYEKLKNLFLQVDEEEDEDNDDEETSVGKGKEDKKKVKSKPPVDEDEDSVDEDSVDEDADEDSVDKDADSTDEDADEDEDSVDEEADSVDEDADSVDEDDDDDEEEDEPPAKKKAPAKKTTPVKSGKKK